jgi:hypothetical protein
MDEYLWRYLCTDRVEVSNVTRAFQIRSAQRLHSGRHAESTFIPSSVARHRGSAFVEKSHVKPGGVGTQQSDCFARNTSSRHVELWVLRKSRSRRTLVTYGLLRLAGVARKRLLYDLFHALLCCLRTLMKEIVRSVPAQKTRLAGCVLDIPRTRNHKQGCANFDG